MQITIDASEVLQTLTNELQQLAAFPKEIASELTDWQVQDMHRRYPNTTEQPDGASTDIWPRSRTWQPPHHPRQAQRRVVHPTQRRMAVRAAPRGTSTTHPILRPELFDQLAERMDKLMTDDLAWQ